MNFDNKSYSGYMIRGITPSNKEIVFITKRNPIAKSKKFFKCNNENSLEKINEKVFSLGLSADIIVFDDNVFFLNENAEGLLGIDTYLKNQYNNIKVIFDTINRIEFPEDIKNTYDTLKYHKYFTQFDDKEIQCLNNSTEQDLINYLEPRKIKLKDGYIDFGDSNTKENFPSLICGDIVEKNGEYYKLKGKVKI